MPKLTVETVPTETLIPYARNAKQHTTEQINQIAASITEFGMNDPIAVWTTPQGQTIIVEGHGRLLALQKLDIQQCPIIRLDHLTDNQRRAYTLTHNQLTLNTGWDEEQLNLELEELDQFEIDMTMFGFDPP